MASVDARLSLGEYSTMSMNYASNNVTYVSIINLQNEGKSSENQSQALTEDISSFCLRNSKTESVISKTIKKYKEDLLGN